MTKTVRTIILGAFAAAALHAAPILTLLSPGADLTGAPGGLVSWNLRIDNLGNWMLINDIRYQTLTPVGTFFDLITPVALPLSPTGSISGELAYSLDSLVPLGTLSTGQLIMTYTMTAVDPDDPGFDPDTDIILDNAEIGVDASVTIAEAAIPEPSTLALGALGLSALGLRRRFSAR